MSNLSRCDLAIVCKRALAYSKWVLIRAMYASLEQLSGQKRCGFTKYSKKTMIFLDGVFDMFTESEMFV
jgi:hypothetical protein